MAEYIMIAGGFVFLVLFLFILWIFVVYILSLFKKIQYPDFEPNLSVIIPAYNEQENISECLSSINQSAYPSEKLEIIVVDDGSADKTCEIVSKQKNILLIKKNHTGKSDTLNEGIKAAKFDYVLIVDADTKLDKNCLRQVVRPLAEKGVAASTGNVKVQNKNSFWGIFQNVEYHYSNLIRHSFSSVFNNGIWFYGCIGCYKKQALEEVGFFKKHSLTEDIDISLELRKKGYRTINVYNAIGYTIVPSTLKGLFKQRTRWWCGGLQAVMKNKKLFSLKSPSILFLFLNQAWWSFFAVVSLPIIIYQIFFWLPYNLSTVFAAASYLFRWFSLLGPVFVIYKIPVWGLSFYSFGGVFAGLLTSAMILGAFRLFREKLTIRDIFAIFFYFPYTIVLNTIILLSLLKFRKISHYIGD